MLLSLVKGVVENKEGNINPQWKDAYYATMDSYLGEIPQEFQFKGRKLDPITYSQEVRWFSILMIMQDQRGITYYLTKNSWGSDNKFGGYLFIRSLSQTKNGCFYGAQGGYPPRVWPRKIEL
ncbi:MAG: hypothetical protein OER04_00560 [Cyclobacteriaceae bacterium]|nr:hypothetical protein [Cyclobacteriaceae bacterium]